MKRVIKKEDSIILIEDIRYHEGGNNSRLREVLFKEQNGFCAYTETFLGRSDKKDIDHFNPSKNFEKRNEYHNLFLTKAQWNSEKSNKWDKFQPIMHPCDENFQERIIYSDGDYLIANQTDIEAKHLYELLKLDDPDLANERKRYINQMKGLQSSYESSKIFFESIIEIHPESLKFLRAIDEEFLIDIKSMIPMDES